MDATAPPPSPAGRAYAGIVYLVAAGVLLQSVFAGQFLSGADGGLRTAHEVLGNGLFALVLAQAVLAVLLVRRGRLGRLHVTAAVGLVLALTAQIGLGYVPAAVTTSIHIPLGVALFGATTWLAALVARGE